MGTMCTMRVELGMLVVAGFCALVWGDIHETTFAKIESTTTHLLTTSHIQNTTILPVCKKISYFEVCNPDSSCFFLLVVSRDKPFVFSWKAL